MTLGQIRLLFIGFGLNSKVWMSDPRMGLHRLAASMGNVNRTASSPGTDVLAAECQLSRLPSVSAPKEALLPTAPTINPTNTLGAISASRCKCQSVSDSHTATLKPNVIGRACNDSVRPIIGVSRCARKMQQRAGDLARGVFGDHAECGFKSVTSAANIASINHTGRGITQALDPVGEAGEIGAVDLCQGLVAVAVV